SLLLYLSALERPPGAAARARYVGSLCALALALGSKASAVSVPVLLGVYLWCFRDRYRLRGPLLGLLPFVGVVGAFLALKAVIPESPEHPLSGPIYRGLPTAIAALGAYLRLLVLPVGLCLDHSLEPARSFADPTVLRALPWGLVLLVGGVLALRRSGAPLLSLAWLLMGIAPVATLIVPGRLIAEARLYGPSVGFCMLAGALLLAVSSLPWLRSAPRVGHAASLVLCALLAATYAGLTVRRSADWSSRERILRDTVAKNPSSHRAHADLASVYILDQKLEAAIPHLRHAIALRPDDGRTLRNLARSCRHTGRYDEAITYYSRALLQQPRNVDLLMGLGIGYVETGQHDEAIEQFETVLRLDPVSAEAHCNVGLAHEMMGNKADAARCYRRCVELGGPAAKKASERLTALDAVQQPPP
ncbi:MAG: tetratricopeptide repeat protein, partial [Armatimonadota bacterium]